MLQTAPDPPYMIPMPPSRKKTTKSPITSVKQIVETTSRSVANILLEDEWILLNTYKKRGWYLYYVLGWVESL